MKLIGHAAEAVPDLILRADRFLKISCSRCNDDANCRLPMACLECVKARQQPDRDAELDNPMPLRPA